MLSSHRSALGAGEPKGSAGRLPVHLPSPIERVDFPQLQPAPSVQLIARDAFVTDMAIKVEQLCGEVRALGREIEQIKGAIGALREDTDRNYRFSAFQESEQRGKAAKLDEVQRRYSDLKTRVDAIDGNRDGNYHLYNSFEAISRKLTELGGVQHDFRNAGRKLKLSAALFCASVVLWSLTLLAG